MNVVYKTVNLGESAALTYRAPIPSAKVHKPCRLLMAKYLQALPLIALMGLKALLLLCLAKYLLISLMLLRKKSCGHFRLYQPRFQHGNENAHTRLLK